MNWLCLIWLLGSVVQGFTKCLPFEGFLFLHSQESQNFEISWFHRDPGSNTRAAVGVQRHGGNWVRGRIRKVRRWRRRLPMSRLHFTWMCKTWLWPGGVTAGPLSLLTFQQEHFAYWARQTAWSLLQVSVVFFFPTAVVNKNKYGPTCFRLSLHWGRVPSVTPTYL